MNSIIQGMNNQKELMHSFHLSSIQNPSQQIGNQHDGGEKDEEVVEPEGKGCTQSPEQRFPSSCGIAEAEQHETEKKDLDAQHGFHHETA
jgi:hypothetical protein